MTVDEKSLNSELVANSFYNSSQKGKIKQYGIHQEEEQEQETALRQRRNLEQELKELKALCYHFGLSYCSITNDFKRIGLMLDSIAKEYQKQIKEEQEQQQSQ